VHIEETEESRVQFTGEQLTDLGKKVDFGGNVRALNKGGWGFASFNSVDRIEEFAQHAIDQAKLVGRSKSELADVEPVRADVLLDLKSDPREVPLKRKVEIFRAWSSTITRRSPARPSATSTGSTSAGSAAARARWSTRSESTSGE